MTKSSVKISAKENGIARDAILASIRASLAFSAPFDAEHRKHHGNHADFQTTVRDKQLEEALIANFTTNLELVGGHCTVVTSEHDASEHVRTVIREIGAKRIAISDSERVKRVVDAVDIIENAPKDLLFDCDLGITSAQWAIAETGTLVLESEAESHRLTSLIPPVHLCILRAAQIRQTLGEILELTKENLSRTITFITGASRTSDIELTLAIGVHGPGELHVVVITDQ